jgi:hypothetical protein
MLSPMRIIIVLLVGLVAGCASLGSVEKSPPEMGTTKEFHHDPASVARAVREVLPKCRFNIEKDSGGTIIAKSDLDGTNGYGDFLRVCILPYRDGTAVRIISQPVALWFRPRDMSGDIFTGISIRLGDLP